MDIPPIPLGTWPTPLEPALRLAVALNLDELWIKRDDLTGLGGGGNKVRKLQYSCAQAVKAGATGLVTTGAPQSNHARLTAAAAARLGLRCTLVLRGHPPAERRGNLILDELAGATVVWAGDAPLDEVAAAQDGYLIPFGGTSAFAAHGYVDCARELLSQLPELDTVVVALGSGGTMAGLVAHLGPDRVYGVDTGALPDPRGTVAALLAEMGRPVDPAALRIDGSQVGAGYATLTEPVRAALALAARTEGLFLDPTYTGRAFAGLCANPPAGKVVFLHTGGLPGLFGHPQV
ncbi:pyridoxal-phosphate dependent enzyme [Couchioplanes caeruleus]|uniref:pyridoxal-phosphate dependent enzyme n=1 Tax=Couchioplanes caeruleus TaxID=56438 RepID=UPI0020BD638B|nr:pyridoxal-phosphate dependent enzyme [Couchioplanes caeruleus]UQU66733.1 pyridoxal-phosphate dependent enzyme [Couchioplanes caeruleus]